jgi:hypothetical protein
MPTHKLEIHERGTEMFFLIYWPHHLRDLDNTSRVELERRLIMFYLKMDEDSAERTTGDG